MPKKQTKKYKVKITRDTIVEAQNEDEAQDRAFDSLIFGDVDFEVEEYEENYTQRLNTLFPAGAFNAPAGLSSQL